MDLKSYQNQSKHLSRTPKHSLSRTLLFGTQTSSLVVFLLGLNFSTTMLSSIAGDVRFQSTGPPSSFGHNRPVLTPVGSFRNSPLFSPSHLRQERFATTQSQVKYRGEKMGKNVFYHHIIIRCVTYVPPIIFIPQVPPVTYYINK